jgi:hypothetical protein
VPIVRKKLTHEYRFTQIPNDWVRDSRLSLKSIGLLAQLLSHSEGWNVTISSLATANNCGRDLIAGAVRELEGAGYLVRQQNRSTGGEFAEVVWWTAEPTGKSPSTGFPATVKPAPVEPATVNPLLKKTISKKTINIEDQDKDLMVSFNEFWDIYPRKMGKGEAKAAFVKAVTKYGLETIFDGVRRLASDPNLPAPQFVPRAATWLNQERWDDEPYPVKDPATIPGVTRGVPSKSPYVGGPREWVKEMHDMGEHFECKPGEFGCK